MFQNPCSGIQLRSSISKCNMGPLFSCFENNKIILRIGNRVSVCEGDLAIKSSVGPSGICQHNFVDMRQLCSCLITLHINYNLFLFSHTCHFSKGDHSRVRKELLLETSVGNRDCQYGKKK